MAITRRKFLGVTAVAGASLALPWRFGVQDANAAQASSPKLAKWIQPLRGLTALGDPLGIPVAAGVPDPVFPNTLMYNITLGEYTDVLHPGLPPTKLWGYWDSSVATPIKRHLGGLIIATKGTATRIRMTNTLPAKCIIPNDPTVQTIPGIPTTENRTAVHLHGGFVPWISDGGPFDYWDPAGNGGPSFLNGPGSLFDKPASPMVPGQADYFYPNEQSTRLMWYHDHAYGITRTNAYAGVATAYPIIDPVQEGALGTMVPPLTSLIPLVFQDKKFVNADPLLGPLTSVQDPTWSVVARPDVQTTGSLWYAHVYDPKEFKLLKGGAYLTPPDPSCIPEFFGDTMLCNGTVAPLVTVEAKRYRFLALNACNARFLNINLLQVAPGTEITTDPRTLLPLAPVAGPVMTQIGTEGGYLSAPVTHTNNKFFNPLTNTGNMLLGCAERSDFIIDFTGLAGREFIMYNDAPGPFPAGPPTTDYFIGNAKNPEMVGVLPGQTIDTRNILKFKVVPAAIADPQPAFAFPANFPRETFLVPYPANAGPATPLAPPAGAFVRNLTLNEDFDAYGRLRQLIGTTTPIPVPGRRNALAYGEEYGMPATETPVIDGIEVWNIYNLTADTHPMHFHIEDVQVLSRQLFTLTKGAFTLTPLTQRGPELDELGWKETVKINPGEVTTVCMKFALPPVPFNVPFSTRGMGAGGAIIPQANEYVWHCHILEHEEHDMMRPLVVIGTNPVTPISVTPPSVTVSGSLGGVASFAVGNVVNSTVTATPLDGGPAAVITATGFDVTIPALTPAGAPFTYSVSDQTGRAAVVVSVNIGL